MKPLMRIMLAAVTGYVLIGVLIAGTDQLFAHLRPGFSSMKRPPVWYFAVSMAMDTVYTFFGGRVCSVISRRDVQATLALIVMGELMGIASTVFLWQTVPHFYSFYLLLTYPAAIWYGAKPRAVSGVSSDSVSRISR